MNVNVQVEVVDGVAHIAIDPGTPPGAAAPRLGKIDITAEFTSPDPPATPAVTPPVTPPVVPPVKP